MYKYDDPTAEGSVAPENLPPEERPTQEKEKKKPFDPTAEGSVAPENTEPETEEASITTETGEVKIENYIFPSKKVTGTWAERQKQKDDYIQECKEMVENSNWIAPTEMTGDLIEGYLKGTLTQEECEQLALEYMMQFGVYHDPGSHSEKLNAVRASVVACQYSNQLTHLDIFEDYGVQDQGGSAVLTCADCRVGENLFSFGICNSPVAAVQNSPLITIGEGKNAVTGHMCMLKVATDWITSEEVHVHIWDEKTKMYKNCLVQNSLLVCTYGTGIIRIVEVPLVNEDDLAALPDGYYMGTDENKQVKYIFEREKGSQSWSQFSQSLVNEKAINQETIEFPIWRLDGNGQKVQDVKRLTVHEKVAEVVEIIFNEIFNDSERFPIDSKTTGGVARRNNNTSLHNYGLAIDINWDANAMFYKNGKIKAGSYYEPNVKPLSIPSTSSVVRIFKKYGWYWGGEWNGEKDYMHFAYMNH